MKDNLQYAAFVLVGGAIGVIIRLVFFVFYQHGAGSIPALNFALSFLAGCIVFGIIGVLD